MHFYVSARRHVVLALSIGPSVLLFRKQDIWRTAWGINFKPGATMYLRRKTIWSNFCICWSKVTEVTCKISSVSLVNTVHLSQEPFKMYVDFKLSGSMITILWQINEIFGFNGSKVKVIELCYSGYHNNSRTVWANRLTEYR